MRTLADRFWAKVDRRGPDDCWPWLAARNNHGYGVMRDAGGRLSLSHRISLALDGRDPAGKVARHGCDNPGCVNPAHLSAGTQAENIADMIGRGRGLVGERNGSTKLTELDVALIRAAHAAGARQADLARQHGVVPSCIGKIIRGERRLAAAR